MDIMILILPFKASFFLAAMATLALLESRSSSLIPKSLFLWPAAGICFSIICLLYPVLGLTDFVSGLTWIVLGVIFMLCSFQAFLVNIRKLSRWPSGVIWLGLVVVGLLLFRPFEGFEETWFVESLRRIFGIIWLAIGVTKVVAEKTVSDSSGVPTWVQLLYVQAVLVALFH